MQHLRGFRGEIYQILVPPMFVVRGKYNLWEVMKMPDFGHPFSGAKKDRKVNEQELIRAIRFMIAAEYEAVQLYMQLAESTDNKLAIEVLKDIADEERVHAGEFLRLLKELDPEEDKFYAEGAEEVEEEIERLKG